MSDRVNPMRGMRYAQARRTVEERKMKTLCLAVKRSLFGLFGMVVVATLGFSSSIPRLPRLVEQEDGTIRMRAATPVSRSSVAAAHGSRFRSAGRLKSDSFVPKTGKTAESMNRKTARTDLDSTGCKDPAPAGGAPADLGGRNTAQKTHDSSKKRSSCNATRTKVVPH